MGTIDIALGRIFRQLIEGNVGLAIAETETYLSAWPNAQTTERLNVLKDEYGLMTDYWKRGAKDPQLDEQYQRLLQRLYVLCANISIHRHMSSSSYLQGLYNGVRQQGRGWSLADVRQEMENFVSEVAMLELEPAHKRKEKEQTLYRHHQEAMTSLFNYVLTGHIWSDGVGQEMEQILLSPTIDGNDQQLLVSAVMLSLLNRFDMVKFRLLTRVYRLSQDEEVRQRALVGWVLSIDDDWLMVYPEQRDIVGELLKSARTCRELTELQMQLVYALNAEKDTTTIQQEIMPDIMKNNSLHITHNGIEEVEEDPMEDVLNPDASEQRMERLETSFSRMMDMQKQGADIYFGGFSQMKRFPFFYDISNWFVPFYMQHPDISQFVQKMEGNSFVEKLVQRGPFCNSDKYSFLIAFQQVFDRLPEHLRQMMKRGEASMGGEMGSEEQSSPAFIRRSYLMDVYRFFRLFPNRSALCNPFDTSKQELGMCLFFGSSVLAGTPLEAKKREVVAMLKKRKLEETAALLLETFPEEMRDVQYYLWTKDYEKALQLEPTHEKALAGFARQAFNQLRYEEAEEAYDRLLLLNPDATNYMLNKAVCQVNMEAYEDALKILFRLDYEHPEDKGVKRVLAWALTCEGKLGQAEQLFQQLLREPAPKASDFQNYGYYLWLEGRISEAADQFRRYGELMGNTDGSVRALDEHWLRQRGISPTEIKMMAALIGA